MINFHIITLFPESISCYFNSSILKRAQDKGLIKINFYNPRDFSDNKHKKVDDTPYAGGPGMVLQAMPILKAIDKAVHGKRNVEYIFFSPSGEKFDSKSAEKYAQHKKSKHIVLINGRYEGVDARVQEILNAKEISIGDFVISGGELASALFVDAVSRFVSGVLGNCQSLEQNRVASKKVYTKPECIKWKGKKYCVPKVLLSGNHSEILKWKKDNQTLI